MSIYAKKVKVKPEEPEKTFPRDETGLAIFLRRNLRPILISGAVIFAGAAFVSIGSYFKRQGLEEDSDMAYFAFKKVAETSEVQAVEKLQDHYVKEGIAPEAAKVANLLFHEGNASGSLSLYTSLSEKSDHNILKSIGFLGEGYSLEAAGKFSEAIEKFSKAKTTTILKSYKLIAALSIARCYEELNENIKALDQYNLIKKEFEPLEEKTFIEKKISLLSS
ncbi:MAG: hypothetical protein ACE5FU_04530 [Nitrospinota bacterium]